MKNLLNNKTMIILKNTKNTQTFYVSKKCGIESGQLPVGSYTKIEADARFQPKGNYISEDKAVGTLEVYNAKVSELEAAIQALQAQIGTISTTLDTINGEVI